MRNFVVRLWMFCNRYKILSIDGSFILSKSKRTGLYVIWCYYDSELKIINKFVSEKLARFSWLVLMGRDKNVINKRNKNRSKG